MQEQIINLNTDIVSKISTILFLYNEPIKILKIKEFLNDENINFDIIKESINKLNTKLSEIGLVVIENKLGNKDNNFEYAISVKSEFSDIAKNIREDELQGDLTPAALQVLTICAYLGASTKNEISFIRGVQSSQSIRSLSTRGLIKKIGDKYTLSIDALQKLGITKIADLPEYEKINKDFTERLKEIIMEKEDN